jgi:hypothetical protein
VPDRRERPFCAGEELFDTRNITVRTARDDVRAIDRADAGDRVGKESITSRAAEGILP